jgi:hypothetical protein
MGDVGIDGVPIVVAVPGQRERAMPQFGLMREDLVDNSVNLLVIGQLPLHGPPGAGLQGHRPLARRGGERPEASGVIVMEKEGRAM